LTTTKISGSLEALKKRVTAIRRTMLRPAELDPMSVAPDRAALPPRGKLRVLLSAFECAPGVGSETEVGWRWALEIARLGHEVVVLTWTRDRTILEAARAAGTVPASVRFEYVMPGWLETLLEGGLPLQLVHLSWQLVAYRHARDLARTERFDLVHHITYCVIRQPSFMGRLPLPFVLGPVGGGETAPLALRRGMGARGWLLDLVRDGLNLVARFDPITRSALAAARLIYVSSPDTARLVPDRLKHKVRVQLQIGIAEQEILAAAPADPHVNGELRLLYVGRCLAWKGMHLGFEALAELRARGRPARLSIAGTGAAEHRWRAMARRLGLDDAVDWLAWVPYERMPEVYRGHDLLLFPSLHDSGGHVVLEALAHGLPVVCFDLGGPGSMVDASCGRVVTTVRRSRAEAIRGLTDALQELADDPQLRRQLGLGARNRVRNYDWRRQVAAVYAEIEAALVDPVAGRARR
jgi:glycosyltransferase involved in cell wall biosynthesis